MPERILPQNNYPATGKHSPVGSIPFFGTARQRLKIYSAFGWVVSFGRMSSQREDYLTQIKKNPRKDSLFQFRPGGFSPNDLAPCEACASAKAGY